MHLTTQLFLFCSILSLKYSLHPPSMFVTLSALIAQPFFLLAFFFFFEMHRLHNFTSWMSSVLSYYLIANLLWSLLAVFVPPLPVSVLATSPLHFLPEFHLWRHQVSCFTLILLLTFFFLLCLSLRFPPPSLFLSPPSSPCTISSLYPPQCSCESPHLSCSQPRFLLSHPFGGTFCEGMSITLPGLCHRNWQNLELNILNKCDCCV